MDDESKPERRPTKHMPTPDQWTNAFNPAYSYYVYYCYANLYTLNKVHIGPQCDSSLTFVPLEGKTRKCIASDNVVVGGRQRSVQKLG